MSRSKLYYIAQAALIIACWVSAAPLQAQVVRQDLCGLEVDFDDQANATFIIKWTYNISTNRREEGGAARPLAGKFVDDRMCAWKIAIEIERSLYLKGPGDSLWVRESSGASIRETFPFRETTTTSSCNDSLARFDSDMAEAKGVVAPITAWKLSDLDRIKELIQEFGDVEGVKFAKGFTAGCPRR